MEHRRRRRRTSARWPPTLARRLLAEQARARRRRAPRPGQVVPGRAAAALADRRSPGAPTASRSGATRRCSTTRGGRPVADAGSADARRRRRSLDRASRPGSASPPEFAAAAVRGPARTHAGDEARLPAGDRRRATSTRRRPGCADPDARAAVVAALDADAGDPAGWVLPLHRRRGRHAAGRPTRWPTRRGRLVLLPGTSPVGLRLPLDSIAWTPPPATPGAGSPFAGAAAAAAPTRRSGARPPPPRPSTPVEDAPTTALCVEERDGHVCRLPAAARASSSRRSSCSRPSRSRPPRSACPVVLEGYPLPGDPRLAHPDRHPGPGRHRGQRAARRRPGPSWSTSTERLDAAGPRGRPGAPRSSPSTARTPAPAAATT